MPNPVQRVRYFDGEFMRSYDFVADQSYHMEMRRQMNLRLHLYGIVYGLRIVMDQDSVQPNGPFFFSVAPGMAIDQSGREMVVPAPYSLSNVLTGPGLSPGWYEVWICYQEEETGLPASGYLDCDVSNQKTRFQESFQVLLNPQGASAPACGAIRLGSVLLAMGSLGLEITSTKSIGRVYVGIRAQRVIAPDEEKDEFDITALNTTVPAQLLPGYLDVAPGTFHRGNLIVKKNEVIGDDFVLDSSKDPNVPSSLPATGNLKITGDCFINGDLFVFINGKCFKLSQVIQKLTPYDLKTDTVTIDTPGTTFTANGPGNTFTGTFSVGAVNSNLAGVTKASTLLAISSIGWRSAKELQSNWSGTTDGFIFKVQPSGGSVSNNSLNLSIDWTIGPVASGELPITSLKVYYLVIFQP